MKYEPLRRWLRAQGRTEVTLNFTDVEAVIGGGLPSAAHLHRAWWGNNESSVQASAWMSAGWLVDAVDPPRRRVRFRRA